MLLGDINNLGPWVLDQRFGLCALDALRDLVYGTFGLYLNVYKELICCMIRRVDVGFEPL